MRSAHVSADKPWTLLRISSSLFDKMLSMLKAFDLSLLGTFPFGLSRASAAKFVFPAQLTAQSGPLSFSLPLNADLLSSGSRWSMHSGVCLRVGHVGWGPSRILPRVSWLGDTLGLCMEGFCDSSAWLNWTRTACVSPCVSILSASCLAGSSAPEPV